MIKHFEVDNFKSLVDFSIDLTETSYIVGNNGAGKSNFLQAIDFVCSSIDEDFEIFLERRNWTIENIKSKFTNSADIKFKLLIELNDDKYEWCVTLKTVKTQNKIELKKETVKKNNNPLLCFGNTSNTQKKFKYMDNVVTPIEFGGMTFHSSTMKNMSKNNSAWEDLKPLIDFIKNTRSYELLSPDHMRQSSRGKKLSIGSSGRDLPAYIKSMTPKRREQVEKELNYLLNGKAKAIGTEDRGRPGWTQVTIEESYERKIIKINSKEMSDGFLRLLAFVVISTEEQMSSVVLLDEIENGINLEYAEKIVDLFKKYSRKSSSQLILTTHNTVILDYVDKNDIIYFFRGEEGESKAVRLFGNRKMLDKLTYMYPGEVLINTSANEIIKSILAEDVK